ncbi:MAG: RNA polymerase sigma factor [Castellaniella sp.]|uniref:RNA polymerase sigma factor n=1 Tax=Castellaniella sp. TaxID=1955812 RepID=UPI001206DB7E|nr:RNA polymerase sigma factor [Castellaniella sp.]TAN28282.1 MAG: RNA polymerase sigma factor [Castellaniella sp.]
MTEPNEARLLDWVPRLRRYARALLRHPDDADDLVQATLERAWSKAGQWPKVTDMRAWLFTLMHNLYVDQLRRPTLTLVQLEDDVADAAATTTPHDTHASLLDLKAALEQLPADQKEIILMVALEDMSYAEVAKTVGIPMGTVMSRLSRARERLRDLMDGTHTRGTPLKRVK